MPWEKVTDAPNGSYDSGLCGTGGLLYFLNTYAGEFHVYDPVAHTWTVLANPANWYRGQLFAVGGDRLVYMSSNFENPRVQMYDITTNVWTVKTPSPAFSRRTQWVSDGSLIYGAFIDSSLPAYGNTGMTLIASYDPDTDTWDVSSFAAPPDYATDNSGGLGWGSLHYIPATASTHASLVYVNGWWDQDNPQGETWILDLGTETWVQGTSQDVPREDQALGSSGIAGQFEYVVVAGGDTRDPTTSTYIDQMASVEAYDILNDVWVTLDDLPVALDDPSLTVWNGYIWVIGGSGDDTDPVAPAPFNGNQTALYRLPYSAFPNNGLLAQPGPDAPALIQLQLEDTVLDTPGYLTVSVSNVPAGGLISFRLDVDDAAHEVDTATADDNGNLLHHDVLVSSHLVNGSTHRLYAHNADSESDSDTFLVNNNLVGEEFMADPVPPVLIPRVGVQRWYFQDPTGQSPDHYMFPRNPHTYSTPYADKVISYDFTTAGPENGQVISMEGKPKPVSWTFEGTLLTKDEENQFSYWFKRSYRIYIVDHENRAYLVYITRFDVAPKLSTNHPEKRDYKMSATVYGYPVQL